MKKIAANAIIFFGSALTGFGVQTFLDAFVDFAPSPSAKKTESGELIDPLQEQFHRIHLQGQANMNPTHRDRITFACVSVQENLLQDGYYREPFTKKMISHTTHSWPMAVKP